MSAPAWHGPLPCEWKSTSLKWISHIYAGGTPDRENPSYWMDGTIPWLNSGSVNQWAIKRPSEYITETGFHGSSARWVPPGSVLLGLAGQGKTKGTAARLEIGATCNQSVAAIVPDRRVEYRFLHYWLSVNHANLRNLSGGDKRDGLNLQHVGSVQVPLPPISDQQQVAEFLDNEIAKIDRLIDKQRTLVESLRGRRISFTSFVLDQHAAHGRRLKWHMEEVDVRAGQLANELPLMSVSIDWGVRRRDEITNDLAMADSLENYKVARMGDLVINRMRAFQGALGVTPIDGLVSPDYAVLRCRDDVRPDWLAALMRSHRFVSQMISRIRGIGTIESGAVRTPRINVSDLGEIRVDVPPLSTQCDAIERLHHENSHIGMLIAKSERLIELSQERRSALITAAVTGQIGVHEMESGEEAT
ncbi:restriction endonuclease subunit S [Kocuria sp. M1N1S27]|uniref:restriction endonuclease subunit S n=1 Tax=Kocuria kalidii TaxID=3376283 RepID=UPI00379BBAE3